MTSVWTFLPLHFSFVSLAISLFVQSNDCFAHSLHASVIDSPSIWVASSGFFCLFPPVSHTSRFYCSATHPFSLSLFATAPIPPLLFQLWPVNFCLHLADSSCVRTLQNLNTKIQISFLKLGFDFVPLRSAPRLPTKSLTGRGSRSDRQTLEVRSGLLPLIVTQEQKQLCVHHPPKNRSSSVGITLETVGGICAVIKSFINNQKTIQNRLLSEVLVITCQY
ncbi:unnamed protein product [Malus baccata var. baccata]